MVTEDERECARVLTALEDRDWSRLLDAVNAADTWTRAAPPGDPRIDEVLHKVVGLANHPKWEIRRAVAHTAAQTTHPAFDSVLPTLAADDNTRVRQAAEHALLRRRDWRHASTLGREHEERINSTLEDIEARFGVRGRAAVRRAADEIANTFARELYHEVIKLLSPLAMSADRLRAQLSALGATRHEVLDEAVRIERRITHLRSVLQAMRAYADQPALTFRCSVPQFDETLWEV